MADYKDTLNLPTTEFPMKANLSQREPGYLQRWEDEKIYQQIRQQRHGKAKFILHDGPPYANGEIHIGHAVNKTLKDIVVKAKTLEGYDAPFVPGWDCHGLPIELNVEKKYGKAGEKLNPKEFRHQCCEYAKTQINVQREAFKRLGVLGDWENPYLTMDFVYESNIVRALAKIMTNGHLQQGFKPVHWCVDCRSALAEAEVEYADKTSPGIDIRFRVINPEKFPGHGTLSMPVWTTTPWTLPANEAVAINPEFNYALVQLENERLLLAEKLVAESLQRYNIAPEQSEILAVYTQRDLKNLRLQHPFYDKIVPLVFGEHVTLDAGTGAVHTAPAHGQEDFSIGQQYRLPVTNPVDEKGCFKPDVELFAGEFVFKANAHIIAVLREKNNLLSEHAIQHSYPNCWRHKTPLIFRATPQWFISMDQKHLRKTALREILKVIWLPDWGQARITGMIEGRPDWCISRQRTWCMPMALIVDKNTKQLHPQMPELMQQIADKIATHGIDAWYELNLTELLGAEADKYEKIVDTLDVWFDSGVSHFAVLDQNKALARPADLYLEGSDQHRGWFQSSLLTSVAMHGKAPYKTVLTHGFTVDEKGRKMSKSLGNVVAPDKVINTLGADILRLWVAATDYRDEIAVSDEILQRTAEAYRRIRNTARFLLANLHDFDPEANLLATNQLLSLDRWIIQQASQLQADIREAYEEYQFHVIYQKLQHFCIVELGGFYLDVIKDRQYTMQKNSHGRRSAQTAIYHVLQAIVRWIAPILSFTAEEIWQYMPVEKNKLASVFLTEWYVFPELVSDQFAWEDIMTWRTEVNKQLELKRNEGLIGSALEASVEITCKEPLYSYFTKMGDELRFALITSQATVKKGPKAIIVSPVNAPKCARCWHRREDVGSHQDHPDICARCVENLPDGAGETRLYV